MATSDERLEQRRRVGCTATRRMPTVTGSAAAAIILQKHRAREEPIKLRAADYVEGKDRVKRDGEVLEEAFNASRSMKVMGGISVCITRTPRGAKSHR